MTNFWLDITLDSARDAFQEDLNKHIGSNFKDIVAYINQNYFPKHEFFKDNPQYARFQERLHVYWHVEYNSRIVRSINVIANKGKLQGVAQESVLSN